MGGPSAQYPERQRFLYSRKSFALRQGPDLFAGLLGMSVDITIEGADPLFGTGMVPLGEPRGEIKVEGELTFPLRPFFEFAHANQPILMQRFNFTGVFQEGSQNDTVGLRTCRIMGVNWSLEGTEATEITVPFRAYDFLLNGKSMVEGDALGATGFSAGVA